MTPYIKWRASDIAQKVQACYRLLNEGQPFNRVLEALGNYGIYVTEFGSIETRTFMFRDRDNHFHEDIYLYSVADRSVTFNGEIVK